jgi:hypothetical protein
MTYDMDHGEGVDKEAIKRKIHEEAKKIKIR